MTDYENREKKYLHRKGKRKSDRVLNFLVRRQILDFLDLMEGLLGLPLLEVIGLATGSSSRKFISHYIKIP